MEQSTIDIWWTHLSGEEQIFWGIAVVSSTLFVIQFILSMIGMADMDTDIDKDFHFEESGGLDLISVRGILAGLMLFGWTGVVILSSGGNLTEAFAWSLVAGILALVGVAYLLKLFLKLQDEGHRANLWNAVDEIAEVYLRIPPNKEGAGKINLVLGNTYQELEAVTHSSKAIPTGAKVKVVQVLDGNLLLVELHKERITNHIT